MLGSLRAIERDQDLPVRGRADRRRVRPAGHRRWRSRFRALARKLARQANARALAAGDRMRARASTRSRVVEQLEVRGHDFAHRRRRRWSRAVTDRARTASRARSKAAVSCVHAAARFDDRKLRCL